MREYQVCCMFLALPLHHFMCTILCIIVIIVSIVRIHMIQGPCQVLPSRTHPVMSTSAASGYVLSGIKVHIWDYMSW